jgi:chromosome segregation ATPase
VVECHRANKRRLEAMQESLSSDRRCQNLRTIYNEHCETTATIKQEKDRQIAETNAKIADAHTRLAELKERNEAEMAEVADEKLQLRAKVDSLLLNEEDRNALEVINRRIMERLDEMMKEKQALERRIHELELSTQPCEDSDSSDCVEFDSLQAPKRRKTVSK